MIGTIWCVGRNYKNHAKEMNAEVPSSPMIFMKSPHCLQKSNAIEIPFFTNHLEHEIEIAVSLDEKIEAHKIALSLDLTARDIQSEAKAKGHPWTLAKSFKGSCLTGEWLTYQSNEWFEKLEFKLSVNGELKQSGKTSDMIFSLPIIIEHLKKYFPVQPGDIILTGTPEGVGRLNNGDILESEVIGLSKWNVVVSN